MDWTAEPPPEAPTGQVWGGAHVWAPDRFPGAEAAGADSTL